MDLTFLFFRHFAKQCFVWISITSIVISHLVFIVNFKIFNAKVNVFTVYLTLHSALQKYTFVTCTVYWRIYIVLYKLRLLY